ncbi:MAG TPA: TIGR03663 family protein, partial [Planctomycetes bacterium]|nr:TIGR03663 family protein [Planctomycetota bacterium]
EWESPRPLTAWLAGAWLVAAVAAAAAFRLADLDNRPMHCDEANQALKFGRVLERGEFVYDPHEHHGPSLSYLTLPAAHVSGAERLADLTETHLRIVPAVAGLLLVALAWPAGKSMGMVAACWSATFTAVSSWMVFYSRYYIQEILLVTFSFLAMVALWRCRGPTRRSAQPDKPVGARAWHQRAWWTLLLGLSLGMMHASKETCLVVWLVLGAAAIVARFGRPAADRTPMLGRAAVVVLLAAGVSMLLFSSFGRRPQGIVDSIAAYGEYFGRAAGRGSAAAHEYPFSHYFRLLFWWRAPGGRLWSEWPVGVLALVGLVAAAAGKGLPRGSIKAARFVALYAVLLTLAYSLIPYKTPWCALGPLHGMLLAAGFGAAVLIRMAPGRVGRAAVVVALLAAVAWESRQAWQASFVANTDPSNPMVYAHTTWDVPQLVEEIERIAAAHPDGLAMPIQVICPEADYWPLPWYLRRFTRVGWLARMPHGPPAPLVVTQLSQEAELAEYLYVKQPPGHRDLFVPFPPKSSGQRWQLRPFVPLAVYVRLDLWQAYQAKQTAHRSG